MDITTAARLIFIFPPDQHDLIVNYLKEELVGFELCACYFTRALIKSDGPSYSCFKN